MCVFTTLKGKIFLFQNVKMTHMKFFCTFINLTTKQVSSPILVVGVADLLLLLYPSLTVSLLLPIVALFFVQFLLYKRNFSF